jgi:hypothetical protein
MLDPTTISADTLPLSQLSQSVQTETFFPPITLYTVGDASRFVLSDKKTDASCVDNPEDSKVFRDGDMFEHFVSAMNHALDYATTRHHESFASMVKCMKDHEELVVPRLAEVSRTRRFRFNPGRNMKDHLLVLKVYATYIQGDRPSQDMLNDEWVQERRTEELAKRAELGKESEKESKETGRPAVRLDLAVKNELFDVCRQVYTGRWTLDMYRFFCYLLDYGDVAGTPRG